MIERRDDPRTEISDFRRIDSQQPFHHRIAFEVLAAADATPDIMGQVTVEILSVGPRELQTSYAHRRQLHVPRRWDMIERYFEVCGFSGRQQRG